MRLASVRTRRPKFRSISRRRPASLRTSNGFRLQNLFGFAICVGFALRTRLPAARRPTVFDNRLRDANCHPQPPKAQRFAPHYCVEALDSLLTLPALPGRRARRRPSSTTSQPCAGTRPCSLPAWPCSALRSARPGWLQAAVGSNDLRPIVAWMIPALSVRYCT